MQMLLCNCPLRGKLLCVTSTQPHWPHILPPSEETHKINSESSEDAEKHNIGESAFFQIQSLNGERNNPFIRLSNQQYFKDTLAHFGWSSSYFWNSLHQSCWIWILDGSSDDLPCFFCILILWQTLQKHSFTIYRQKISRTVSCGEGGKIMTMEELKGKPPTSRRGATERTGDRRCQECEGVWLEERWKQRGRHKWLRERKDWRSGSRRSRQGKRRQIWRETGAEGEEVEQGTENAERMAVWWQAWQSKERGKV